MRAMEITIRTEAREGKGKGEARKLRAQGKIPGVFYFHNEVNIPLFIDLKDMELILKHRGATLQVEIPEVGLRRCILREVQRHPATEAILHFDLQGVVEGERVTVKVPLHLTGTPEGAKEGGILEQGLDEVEIECQVQDIPEALNVDVSGLKIGESLHIGDLKYPQFRFLDDPNAVIAHIAAPKMTGEIEVPKPSPEEEAPKP